jgi:hypothetical protein
MVELMSSTTKKEGISPRIALPTAGIDGINHAVKALYTYKKPAGYKELARPIGLSEAYISMSLSAARQVGLTRLTGKERGQYELTEAGERYALYLSAGKETESREILKQTIMENPWWSEIIKFLRISNRQERDISDLIVDIEGKSGKKWSNRMRGTIGSALTSILSYADLVESKGNKIISNVKPETPKAEEEGQAAKEPKAEKGMTIEGRPEEGFAEFRMPDSFILYVKKDKSAIEFFEKQVNETSIFMPWLSLIKKKMTQGIQE